MSSDTEASFFEQLEAAVSSPDPAGSALRLATAWRDEGISQRQIYHHFDVVRARHMKDVDERKLDAILDTMDFISGHCPTHMKLFPDNVLE